MRSLLLTASLLALLPGCPGQLQPPARGEGTPCDTIDDCNPGRDCGDLFLCIDRLCEAEPSLVVPCPGEGERPRE